MSDQIIKVELIIETNEALKRVQASRQIINDLKLDLTALANATKAAGVPIDQLGEKLSLVFKNRKIDLDKLISATREYQAYLKDLASYNAQAASGGMPSNQPPPTFDFANAGFDKQQIEDFIGQIEALRNKYGLLKYDIEDFADVYYKTIEDVIKETQQAAEVELKFGQSVNAANASVSEAVVYGNQLSEAQKRAGDDLRTYFLVQKDGITATNALANARKALLKSFTDEQLKPFRGADGKLATGSYDPQELANAKKNIRDYDEALKLAGSSALKLAQEQERVVEQSKKLAESANLLARGTTQANTVNLDIGTRKQGAIDIEGFKSDLRTTVKQLEASLGPEFLTVGKSLKKSLVEGYTSVRLRDIRTKASLGQVISKEELAQARVDINSFKKMVNEVVTEEEQLVKSKTKIASATGLVPLPDIDKVVQASLQEAQAVELARNNLIKLMQERKIAVGDTVALAKAQQDLVQAYKEQVVLKTEEKFGVNSQQALQARAELAKYVANTKTAMGEIKQGWQETARVESEANREAKRKKKEEDEREKYRIKAWQNEQKGFWSKSQGGLTSALPPTGWGAGKTTSELKEMAKATNTSKGAFSSLAGVARTLFAGVLGITAIGVVRDLISWMMKGTDAAIQYQQSLYLLEIGIRALQKEGFETTVEGWYDAIAKFKKLFPVFTQQEIVGGFSVAILKLREYGATQEEINRILEISGTLALAYGRDFQEMVNSVSGAITRGYFEALQSMGIAIGRINIMQDAMQQGLEGGLTALTEQQRFKLAFNILDENVSALEADMQQLGTSGEASFIKLRQATADATDAQRKLGESFIGVKVAFEQLKAALAGDAYESLVRFQVVSLGIEAIWNQIGAQFNKFIAFTVAWNNNFSLSKGLFDVEGFKKDLDTAVAEVDKASRQMKRELADQQIEIAFKNNLPELAEMLNRIRTVREMDAQEYTEYLRRLQAQNNEILGDYDGAISGGKNYVELMKQLITGLQKSWKDYKKSLDALNAKYTIDVSLEVDVKNNIQKGKIQLDYEAELQKIEDDLAKSIADAWSNYYKSLADLERDYQQQLAKSQEDHRIEELRAEEEHLKDMRRLREDYLYDLSDALKERDAIQIIRLTREYNVEKQRREEDYADQKRQREEDYERQREERAREYEQRREELRYELQQRLQMLQIEAQQRREEALAQRNQALADAKAQYEEQKAALEKALQDQFNLQMDNLLKTLGITKAEMDKFIKSQYEVGSPMYNMWEAYREYARTANLDAINFLDQVLGRMGTVMYYFNVLKQMYMGINSGMFGPGFAEGGRYPVGKTILVGERGPELVKFDKPGEIIPADITAKMLRDMTLQHNVSFGGVTSDISSSATTAGSMDYNINTSGKMDRRDKVEVGILLSPDLIGKIIDTTLDEAAGVVVNVVNRRR